MGSRAELVINSPWALQWIPGCSGEVWAGLDSVGIWWAQSHPASSASFHCCHFFPCPVAVLCVWCTKEIGGFGNSVSAPPDWELLSVFKETDAVSDPSVVPDSAVHYWNPQPSSSWAATEKRGRNWFPTLRLSSQRDVSLHVGVLVCPAGLKVIFKQFSVQTQRSEETPVLFAAWESNPLSRQMGLGMPKASPRNLLQAGVSRTGWLEVEY